MLPTSAKIKRLLVKGMNERVKHLTALKTPLVQGIRRHMLFEGNRLGVSRFDGSTSVSEVRSFEASSLVTKEEASTVGISKVVDELSTQLADSQSKAVLESLSEAVNEVGNTVDGKGKPFSPELFLESIDKIHLDFEGLNPKLPTMVCHPSAIDRFKQVIEQTMTTEPYKSQYQALMEKKKREFDEREARRKLVD